MENGRPDSISYYEHEAEIARCELHSKRWMIATIVAFVALIASNLAWVLYESQFQEVVTETYTATTDQGGDALNLIANDEGTITYGGESDIQ